MLNCTVSGSALNINEFVDEFVGSLKHFIGF